MDTLDRARTQRQAVHAALRSARSQEHAHASPSLVDRGAALLLQRPAGVAGEASGRTPASTSAAATDADAVTAAVPAGAMVEAAPPAAATHPLLRDDEDERESVFDMHDDDPSADDVGGHGPAINGQAALYRMFRAPPLEARLPAPWWTEQDDASLLLGTDWHGYMQYGRMLQDPRLSFSHRDGLAAAFQVADERGEDVEGAADDIGTAPPADVPAAALAGGSASGSANASGPASAVTRPRPTAVASPPATEASMAVDAGGAGSAPTPASASARASAVREGTAPRGGGGGRGG